MKRLLPRLPRPRAQAPPVAEPHTAEAPTTPPAAEAGAAAGTAPQDAARPSYRHRGRLRRRLRFLRRVRELGFRDLGGLVFDQHRFNRVNEELVAGKLVALGVIDAEMRALERAMGDRRAVTELHEPGVSACPRCGTLHGSDARFCPSCGASVRGPRAMADVGEGPHAAPAQPIGADPPPAPPASGPDDDGTRAPTVVTHPGAETAPS